VPLDMRGSLGVVVVPGQMVQWLSPPRPIVTTACIARELLRRRVVNTRECHARPDLSARYLRDTAAGMDAMDRISQAYPVMRACRTASRCEAGDTCA